MRVNINDRVTLHCGDSRDVLKTLADASIDSVVCDPPYALVSIAKRYGSEDAVPAKGAVYARASAGFMGQTWDTGETAFAVEFWAEVMRVLKPGGHLLAFSGSRTYHRMVCAIEDAGFEVRDQIMWLYGSGFPKSHDVSKGIDKAAGAEREVVGQKRNNKGNSGTQTYAALGAFKQEQISDITAPATDAARQWSGWGTALKPAHEPIVMARKPLVGTVAANVLAHGTGALNVGACKVPLDAAAAAMVGKAVQRTNKKSNFGVGDYAGDRQEIAAIETFKADGRWPANVIHDGSDEVVGAFPETSAASGGSSVRKPSDSIGTFKTRERTTFSPKDAGGSAARFFYCAKASKADRGEGNIHPTVKPRALMAYLCRLVTPPGGTILDPFMGSGSTGIGASMGGFSFVGIEREAEYFAIAEKRLRALEPEKPAADPKDPPTDLFGWMEAAE